MAGRWLRSQVRSSVRVATTTLKLGLGVVLGSLAATTAFAQQAQTGNPQRGATLASTCLGCHGIEGYRNAYPDYAVPRLAGQHAEYLEAALKEYRSGARDYPTMHLQALSLSDQDIADVAAYLASKPVVAASTPTRQPEIPKAAAVCTSCHGSNGIGVTPMYPSLAGQHASYLARAIQEYQAGNRSHGAAGGESEPVYRINPIMDAMAAPLKPADITAIANYFSSLKPGLRTESRPFFRWTEGSQATQR